MRTAYITDLTYLEEMNAIEQSSFPTPWAKEDIEHDILDNPASRYIGVFDGDELAGWGCLWLRMEEVLLATVSVRRDKRRQGFGTALMNALIQAASDAGGRYIELQCRRGNTAAQAMYGKLGFLRVGKQLGYYTDTGEDAWIYVKIGLPEAHPENDPGLISE